MQITLIGTRHKELGKCNSNELYQILKNLRPDVIFEEMPLKDFDDYYVSKKRSKLESIAIFQYKQDHDTLQIPVDMDDIPKDEFLDAYENIFKTVYDLKNQYGLDFRELTKQVSMHTMQYGFRYLNSIDYANVWEQVFEIIENTLRTINNDTLFNSLALWKRVNIERENKMLEGIYTFYQNSSFENAVFLIGAYHRKSIIEKIPKVEENRKVNLVWHFDTLPAPNTEIVSILSDK